MVLRSLPRRRLIQLLWDLTSWTVAIPLAVLLRYDFGVPPDVLPQAVWMGFLSGLSFVLLGSALRLYTGKYIVGSFDEVFGILSTSLLVGTFVTVLVALLGSLTLPRSTPILGTGVALAMMLGGRFAWRNSRLAWAKNQPGTRTLILGAGDAGQQVAELMLADRTVSSQPIGFIDDDPHKRHHRRAGLKVLGDTTDLERLVQANSVEVLLVAIAGITAKQLLDLDRRCASLGVQMRVIPTASELFGGAVRLGDISDVTEEDLLGRRPIETNELEITEFLEGKRVLVTGAGGSIGSELVRQVARYSPERLFLLDRDESALHATQLSLDASGTLTSDSLVLADLRDGQRVLDLFYQLKPDIVFHAAALKHLPLLQRYPSEALKTNVMGTLNALSAARAAGVEVFVNISTDKAASPTSVLGLSKLVTERLTAGAPLGDSAKCVSVRFGNVLGSRGSVLHTFRYQIANGGPVTVTDENVTRFFMTVGEAVHLVLQAAVIGSNGETLILDMGEPVRIADVARYMIERSGRDIELRFTGLREGEKLDEVLVAPGEAVVRPIHPLISHTRVRGLPAEVVVDSLADDRESERALWRLADYSSDTASS